MQSRALYTWGTDDNLLWLVEQPSQGRSLTNDIENCLVEIQCNLENPLTDFTIIYQDSDGEWDGVKIIEFNRDNVVKIDAAWLSRKAHYGAQYIRIDFYFIGGKTLDECKRNLSLMKSIPQHLS